MIRPLPRLQHICMTLLEHKSRAAVLQRKAVPRRDYARAKFHKEGVDEGAGAAVGVGDGKVDGVAGGGGVGGAVRDVG